MGGKHMKRLRAEKSKVQLKKKKLSKGENLTSTKFTVKKISTKTQLQKIAKDEPVSNWNVPLKDLITRLSHYNFTSRLNSLTGIKELLGKHPEILRGPLMKPLITKLLDVVTDEECKIRMAALNLLAQLFELMPSTSISAFNEILNLHLGCAMTHRNVAVQQESLKLIDILVKYSPEALKWNFKAIAQNFLRILKSYFYESHTGMFLSGKSKQDLERVKREMLFSFYEFLIAGYPRVTEQNLCKSKDKKDVKILANEKIYVRDFFAHYKSTPYLSIFKSSENKEKLIGNFNLEDFMCLCSNVMPLIFDLGNEFFPNKKLDKFSTECELPESIGELLSTLLKILLFLYEITTTMQDSELEYWFVSNYSSAFKKTFVLNFPYVSSMPTKKPKSTNFCDITKEHFMVQNLTICFLAYSFKIIDKDNILEKKVENYVVGALMSNVTENKILAKVIEAELCAAQHKNSNIILHKALEAYHMSGNADFKQSLLKILIKVVLGENQNLIEKDENLKYWIKSLPQNLCKSQVLLEELEIVLKMINTSKGVDVLKEVEFKAEEIMDNVKNITLEGSYLKGYKIIADILYRCSRTVLMRLMNEVLLGKRMFNQEFDNYVVNIFSQKIN